MHKICSFKDNKKVNNVKGMNFMYNFRTDLALERRELYKKAHGIQEEVEGIEIEEDTQEENIQI